MDHLRPIESTDPVVEGREHDDVARDDWQKIEQLGTEEITERHLAERNQGRDFSLEEEQSTNLTDACSVWSVGGEGLPTAGVTIRGQPVQLRLDSCAVISVGHPKLAILGEKQTGEHVTAVRGISGRLLPVIGVWRFEVKTLYSQLLVLDVHLVDGIKESLILGLDVIRKRRARLDFETCELTWQEDDAAVIIPFRCSVPTATPRVAVIRNGVARKFHAESLHRVNLPVEACDGSLGIFYPKRVATHRLLLAPTLATVREGHVTVAVLNTMGRKIRLPTRQDLGTWVPLSGDMDVLELVGGLSNDAVLQWVKEWKGAPAEKLDNTAESVLEERLAHLEPNDRAVMLEVLRSFPTLTKQLSGCPPLTTTGVEHHIATGSTPPIFQRRYRNSFAENQIIKAEVDKMLEDGVIEPGHGAWGFPVVLVKKRNGEVRFCVDYRALNAVTKKDVYPLPRIDETIEAMGGARTFTTLDLKAGYWQIGVRNDDKEKTAFTTREGLYQFVRMPFGLTNAPGTFQRMMDCILRGLLWVCCLVYLDDIIVYSRGSIGRHALELAAVLDRLAQAGVTLNLKKCQFAAPSIEYLGHELGRDGIRPIERLVTAVREFPQPTSRDEVRRFVYLAGYYRRFIKSFGLRLSPLTKLLRKKELWVWGEEQQAAFEFAKHALTTRPVLAYPDFALPFELATDASAVGLGAVLMQRVDGGVKPIAYLSRVNSTAEAKYPITQLECLAVVWAIRELRPYLYGHRFTLITDHQALKWLMTSRNLPGRLHRWALALQEYDFDVVYRPGRENVVPDALSRAPVVNLAETLQVTDDDILQAQKSSELCIALEKACNYRGQWVGQHQGLLRVRQMDGKYKIVLPPALWPRVFEIYHDSIYAGHLRAPQLYHRVATLYWWPGMREAAYNWVMSCHDCGSRKARPQKIVPPLRSLGIGVLCDRWGLDVAGPLHLTEAGNRYVVALVEYASKFVVAEPVATHDALTIARVIMDRVVLVHGPFRELLVDGAKEFGGKVVTALADLLQAKVSHPVPYRPNLMGQVERFNRTWKDMVALWTNEAQDDWDQWLSCATYAYNSARQTTTQFPPYELMTGRKLRGPDELLRVDQVGEIKHLGEWHRQLQATLRAAHDMARAATAREQQRQARYYDRRVRVHDTIQVGRLYWAYKPPRGPRITKLRHLWKGPMRAEAEVGHDNWRLTDLEDGTELVTHVSFLTPYRAENSSAVLRERITRDLRDELTAELRWDLTDDGHTEDANGSPLDPSPDHPTVAAVTRSATRAAAAASNAVPLVTTDGTLGAPRWFREHRRRRQRNRIGRRELEIEVEEVYGDGRPSEWAWYGLEDYEELWKVATRLEDDEQPGTGCIAGDAVGRGE